MIVDAILHSAPEALAPDATQIPPAMRRLLQRMMAKHREERPAGAAVRLLPGDRRLERGSRFRG